MIARVSVVGLTIDRLLDAWSLQFATRVVLLTLEGWTNSTRN